MTVVGDRCDDDELLSRTAARARTQSPVLAPPVGAEEVAAAERQLGLELPVLLRRLYGEVANGGFGPQYLLLPLAGDGRTVVSAYLAEYGPEEERTEPPGHWPRGVVPVLAWGRAMYAAVDCLRPGGPVLLFDPNAGPENRADAWFQDAPSLAAWLQAWLDGTGWWEEDVMLAPEPRPWPEASERLRTCTRLNSSPAQDS